ncbi:hypothetical protein [Lactococcus lactis]|uniref:hypothetical protein n=1 Tax=Lactococcus lactis TaxID=1358 RepID=UPI0022E5328E|nr:hypothetical protein [Lactococcus lactis]
MEIMIKFLEVISGTMAILVSLAAIAAAGYFRDLKYLVIGLSLLAFTCLTAV